MKRKIFLSIPMKGRENIDIQNSLNKMKKVLLAMYPEDDLEFYDNFESGLKLNNSPAVNNAKFPALKYLGMAISKMADCDYMAMVETPLVGYGVSKGCMVEDVVANNYYGYNNIIRLRDNDGSIYLPDLKRKAEEYDKEHATKEEIDPRVIKSEKCKSRKKIIDKLKKKKEEEYEKRINDMNCDFVGR